jgi:DNA-binding MarR family transcriptional regulator
VTEPETAAALQRALEGFSSLTRQNNVVLGLMADRFRLNKTDLRALLFLAQNAETTPKQLAEHLQLTTGATTPLIDRLDDAGTLRRISHPTDRRSALVELTPKGLETAERLAEFYGSVFRDALGAEHLDHFGTMLHTLSDALARITRSFQGEAPAPS